MTDIEASPAEPSAQIPQQPQAPAGSSSLPNLPRRALLAWWWQGLRTAFFLRPQWAGLLVSPQLVAALVMVGVAASVGLGRLYVDGPATFYDASLVTSNWFNLCVVTWVCWLVTWPPQVGYTAPKEAQATEAMLQPQPGMAALLAMLMAQGLIFIVINGLLMLPVYRSGLMSESPHAQWFYWGMTGTLMAWYALAQIRVIWVVGDPRWATRLRAAVLVVGSLVALVMLHPPSYWYPARPSQPASDADATPPFRLTQDLLEGQPRLLQTKLQALTAEASEGSPKGHQVPAHGAPRLFAITFAPYAEADVFARESQVVADVMQARFHTAGRTIQLINNRGTSREWPWATPLNLQRTIQRMAQLMDRDNDVLFIHLTSHGARDGQLSSDFEPLSIDPVTPQSLKQWLDQAGIKWRVISISACYSGSWIQPLANEDTLVMTAADADHTSYGCGSRSTLTFFGRAMYEEQLRQTLSFEQAHAAARKVIDQREREAGKTDGYSNPQISVGAAVRPKLLALEAGLLRSER